MRAATVNGTARKCAFVASGLLLSGFQGFIAPVSSVECLTWHTCNVREWRGRIKRGDVTHALWNETRLIAHRTTPAGTPTRTVAVHAMREVLKVITIAEYTTPAVIRPVVRIVARRTISNLRRGKRQTQPRSRAVVREVVRRQATRSQYTHAPPVLLAAQGQCGSFAQYLSSTIEKSTAATNQSAGIYRSNQHADTWLRGSSPI